MKLDWMTDESRLFLKDGYTYDQTAEERYIEMANTIEKYAKIDGFANKVLEYVEKQWLSFASPEIANLGKDKGLPASCNFLMIEDTIESIQSAEYEMAILASQGAGTARGFSKIRPKGERYGQNGLSEGVCSWIESYASKILKISQNGTRRGFLTAYLSVDHPEIMEFLKIGREGHPITKITTAVTYPKGWMEEMLAGDKTKQKIFAEVHQSRSEIGYPYQMWEDNSNVGKHQVYVDNGMWLNMSNICTECIEYSGADKEFVCVLASANLAKWDEWKDTDFIFDMNIILDCVTSEYIDKAKKIKGLEKAVKFAEEHRAIGVGVMGFHTLLQQKGYAYGDVLSRGLNRKIFKYIREESDRASKWMAKEWGEPKMLIGYGDRNTSRLAVAPTKSTSAIMGFVSQGIEPIKNNYHTKDLAKIMIDWKNPQLEQLLIEKGQNTQEVWDSILLKSGSVQHLDFLDKDEKAIFRTFTEIPQLDLIQMAGDRQQYIDQAQSLNVNIPTNTPAKDILKLSVEAWRSGVKTMYYQYSVNQAQEYTSSILSCSSCES